MNRHKEKLLKLGRNIKRERKLKGLTQEYVALKADVSLSYYGRVERGEQNITILYLLEIAEVIEVNPCTFLLSLTSHQNNN